MSLRTALEDFYKRQENVSKESHLGQLVEFMQYLKLLPTRTYDAELQFWSEQLEGKEPLVRCPVTVEAGQTPLLMRAWYDSKHDTITVDYVD